VVNTIGDLFDFDQVYVRNMLVPIEGEDDFEIAGNPIKLGGIPDDPSFGRPPTLGEHNDVIMRDLLGYSIDEIRGLYEVGVLSR
jgi:crotonobetainyl-CoA:carnitine CoA-transferase CaiB-like acyl-CoA transferase